MLRLVHTELGLSHGGADVRLETSRVFQENCKLNSGALLSVTFRRGRFHQFGHTDLPDALADRSQISASKTGVLGAELLSHFGVLLCARTTPETTSDAKHGTR